MGQLLVQVPERERPRERLVDRGRESLSDAELLALLLRSGTSGTSVIDLACGLLAEFGTLRQLSSAGVEELSRVPGVGPAKAAALVAGFELSRRVSNDRAELPVLSRISDIARAAQGPLSGLRRERVVVFVCDRRRRILRCHQLSEGSDRRVLIEIREVLNVVLRHDGAAFALAHNHPSGDPTPSQADIDVTTALGVAAKSVGLRFLGHVVVTDTDWSSVPTSEPNRV